MKLNNFIILAGLILIVIITFLTLPVSYAATDTIQVDDVFKINEHVNYVKPCVINGTYCSSNAFCNYTMFNPDKSLLVSNDEATKLIDDGSSYFNYSITPVQIGLYQVDMSCDDNGRKGIKTLWFEVTGSGFNDTLGFYVLIIVLSIGIIAIGLWRGDSPITILGSFGLYFLGFYILFNGIVGIKDLVTTWAIGLIILGVAFYVSARATYELIT